MELKIEEILSPNVSPRRGSPVCMIVYHYTGSMNIDGTISWFANSGSKVSAHYLIDYKAVEGSEQTRIIRMARHADKAWHAGKSEWEISEDLYQRTRRLAGVTWKLPKKEGKRLITGVNQCSIGIELVGMEGKPFPDIQMATVINLTARIMNDNDLHDWKNIVGHEQVSPGRKSDPGDLFDWEKLVQQTDRYLNVDQISIIRPITIERIPEPTIAVTPRDRMGSGKDLKRNQIQSGWRLFFGFLAGLFKRKG